jgi:zinc/manganese transport system permease protein
VARASGVPVRAVGVAFMLILGAVAGEATQAVGALLLLGLIAAPAGAARRLTADPWTGLALSTAIAVACMWIGLALSYAINGLPPSSAVILTAAVTYLLAAAFAGRMRATARLPWLRGSVADQDALG